MKTNLLVGVFLVLFLSPVAHALTLTLSFSGECDDCAFSGDPNDEGFNALGDGLTQSVTARLIMDGLSMDSGNVIDYTGSGTVIFEYDGSSLINPFTMHDPYLFTPGLKTDGTVINGGSFHLASTQNITDPADPLSFDFPNFCTSLGQAVLGEENCSFVGDVS